MEWFVAIVVGVFIFMLVRIIFLFATAERCMLCNHFLWQHKKLRVEGKIYHECRWTDCDCDYIEETPDFLRDCYGLEEHEKGQ